MSSRARTVVVGGGIVGCSVLYWLTRMGWTDVLLLEKNELTSGSTWHAAGNVTFFGHYPSITRLYVNSAKTYLQAEAESGLEVGFHHAGSLRLATSEAELEAYRQLEPMYRQMQVDYAVVDPQRITELHPLLNVNGVIGAAHTPTDGHCDPSAATQAMARAARDSGAEIQRQAEVKSIRSGRDGWTIETEAESILTEHVVIAASFWSRELLQPLGLSLPLYALEHHEIVTDSMSQLEALDCELPAIRDPWSQSNTRQEGLGLLCGVYEPEPRFWSVDGIPPDFNQELLQPDVDRLEDNLERVIERIPAFGETGIKIVNNGPICYTPDGCPLLGPVDGYPGLWLAAGFAIGIGTGGGSGEYLAHWMVNGKPGHELPIVYPSRFDPNLSRDVILQMIKQTYAAGYRISDR